MNGIFDTNLGTFGAANSLPGKFYPYVLVDIIWLARWIGLVLQTNFDVNVFSEKWILLKLELSTKICALIGGYLWEIHFPQRLCLAQIFVESSNLSNIDFSEKTFTSKLVSRTSPIHLANQIMENHIELYIIISNHI